MRPLWRSWDNLHGVWDNCILHAGTFGRVYQRADYKKSWDRFTVIYRAADTLQASSSLNEERQIVQGEPWQWAAESYRSRANRQCATA